MTKLGTILAILALPTLATAATDNPWVGTWVLDPAKSQLTGDTFTITQGAGKMLHFSDGSTIGYDFGTDGKDYKTAYNHVSRWTATAPNEWDRVVMADGKEIYRAHQSLSADGKTLTITGAGTLPDGSANKQMAVYERVTGTSGTGLVGKWQSSKVNPASDRVVIASTGKDTISWTDATYQQRAQGKMDGSDNPLTGKSAPPGMTVSWKQDNATTLSYTVKLNGKPDTYGRATLSQDGKSYTDVSWSPGKESEKSTAVFMRQ